MEAEKKIGARALAYNRGVSRRDRCAQYRLACVTGAPCRTDKNPGKTCNRKHASTRDRRRPKADSRRSNTHHHQHAVCSGGRMATPERLVARRSGQHHSLVENDVIIRNTPKTRGARRYVHINPMDGIRTTTKNYKPWLRTRRQQRVLLLPSTFEAKQ